MGAVCMLAAAALSLITEEEHKARSGCVKSMGATSSNTTCRAQLPVPPSAAAAMPSSLGPLFWSLSSWEGCSDGDGDEQADAEADTDAEETFC